MLLKVKAQELADAKAEVAQRRREAAANLKRKETLEQQAKEAKQKIAELVVARQKARDGGDEGEERRPRPAEQAPGRARPHRGAHREEDARPRRSPATSTAAASSMMPVQGPITSPFGWRIHPIYGYRSLHDGVDIGAGCGTPIHAAADGVVISEYYQTAWGNRIIIDHGIHRGVGVTTISNHLSGYAVSTGAHVTRGQVVGYVGTTGWSTGCHLHFTVQPERCPRRPDELVLTAARPGRSVQRISHRVTGRLHEPPNVPFRP